jgi:Helix-hairpin-helix motif
MPPANHGLGGALMLGASLVIAAVSVARSSGGAGTPPIATDAEYAALRAIEMQSLNQVCGSQCHRLELFSGTPRSYDVWHDTVQKMIDRGAVATDEQLLDIMDYLHRTLTTVNVNVADAEELALVLNASPAQVQAIVARRNRRRFSDLVDLLSVPEIDAESLRGQADKIVF